MKTRILLSILTGFFSMGLLAQTNVGGTLTSDAIWSISGSPYNVISNVGVPGGITLTIESGVTINFNNNHQIIIHGNLIANGDNDMNIVFNGNVTGSAMILFQNTNLNNSSLSYLNVNGPKSGIRLSTNTDDNNSGTLTINKLTMINSEIKTNGYDSYAQLVIDSSSITNSNIYGEYPKSEVININNCNINGGEIISDSYNYGIFLNNATIANTSFKSGCCGANVNISGSTINDASFNQDLGSQPGKNNYLNIDDSQVTNSIIDMRVSTVNINTSSFYYDDNYALSSCIISGNGTIEFSSFEGNGDLIAVERGPYGYSYDNNSPYIFTFCNFSGFETNIKINAQEGSTFGNGPVSITYCDFLDTPPNYVILNNSPYDATATTNWWGTIEISEIEDAIYDYWDDMAKGEVSYAGFLSSNVGIQSLYSNSVYDISISPNPFSIETILKTNIDFKNVRLTIYNMNGQIVKTLDNISGQEIKLHRDDLPNGTFILYGTLDNRIIMTGKLIITN